MATLRAMLRRAAGHDLSRRFVGFMSLRVAAALANLAFVAILGFVVTKEVYGQISVMMSAAILLSTLGNLGQRISVLRDVSRRLAGPSPLFRPLAFLATSTLSLAGGAQAGLVFALVRTGQGADPSLAAAAAALTAILAVSLSWMAIARAFGHVWWSSAPRELLWRMLALGIVYVAVPELPATAAAVAWILAGTMAALLALQITMVLASAWRNNVDRAAASFPMVAPWANAHFTVTAVGGLFLVHADIVAVGFLVGPGPAAEYFLANRLAAQVAFFHMAGQLVIAPHWVRRHAAGELSLFQRELSLTVLAVTALTALACAALLLLIPWLAVVFPVAGPQTPVLLAILLAAQVVQVAAGFPTEILIMSGHEAVVGRIFMATILGGGLLIAGAGLSFGSVGIAAAVLVTSLLRTLSLVVVTRRRLGIDPTLLAWLAPASIAGPGRRD